MLKIGWHIFRFLLPILFLAFPLLAIIGLFKTWQHDELVLADRYNRHWSVLSGYIYSPPVTETPAETYTAEQGFSQRSYWLIPKGWHAPGMISITYYQNGMVFIEEDAGAFWRSLFWFSLFSLSFYQVWVRKWEPSFIKQE